MGPPLEAVAPHYAMTTGVACVVNYFLFIVMLILSYSTAHLQVLYVSKSCVTIHRKYPTIDTKFRSPGFGGTVPRCP